MMTLGTPLHARHRYSHRDVRRAFTLVEALLASTILAVVAASASLPFSAGLQGATEAQELEQAVELGEAFMEEILARPFFAPKQTTPTPGPDSGETTRLDYDSIDDYSGYSESDKVLRNFKGAAITDTSVQGFWRESSVQFISFAGMQTGDTNSLARITVKVYRGNELLVTLDRLVSRED